MPIARPTTRNRDPQVAEDFALRAAELTNARDAYALHTLARVRFNAGRLREAVRLQRDAVRARSETGDAPQYEKYYADTLAEYEAACTDPALLGDR